MSLRLHLAALLFPVGYALPAGIATVAILSAPPLAEHARWLLAYVAAESCVIGAAITWHLAPLLLRR